MKDNFQLKFNLSKSKDYDIHNLNNISKASSLQI